VVLILPFVIAWAVLGVAVTVRAVTVLVGHLGRKVPAARLHVVIPALVAVIVVGLAVVSLGAQFPRDYLFSGSQSSSHPGGSTYMALLHDLGPPTTVVETDYVWTTAVDTGHRTVNPALDLYCDAVALRDSIVHGNAGFLLSAGLNAAGIEVDIFDSPCHQRPGQFHVVLGPPRSCQPGLTGRGRGRERLHQVGDRTTPSPRRHVAHRRSQRRRDSRLWPLLADGAFPSPEGPDSVRRAGDRCRMLRAAHPAGLRRGTWKGQRRCGIGSSQSCRFLR